MNSIEEYPEAPGVNHPNVPINNPCGYEADNDMCQSSEEKCVGKSKCHYYQSDVLGNHPNFGPTRGTGPCPVGPPGKQGAPGRTLNWYLNKEVVVAHSYINNNRDIHKADYRKGIIKEITDEHIWFTNYSSAIDPEWIIKIELVENLKKENNGPLFVYHFGAYAGSESAETAAISTDPLRAYLTIFENGFKYSDVSLRRVEEVKSGIMLYNKHEYSRDW